MAIVPMAVPFSHSALFCSPLGSRWASGFNVWVGETFMVIGGGGAWPWLRQGSAQVSAPFCGGLPPSFADWAIATDAQDRMNTSANSRIFLSPECSPKGYTYGQHYT